MITAIKIVLIVLMVLFSIGVIMEKNARKSGQMVTGIVAFTAGLVILQIF